MKTFLTIALIVFAALGIVPAQQAHASTPKPDWTVAPCSWFFTGHRIPPYTHTDECVTSAGKLVHFHKGVGVAK